MKPSYTYLTSEQKTPLTKKNKRKKKLIAYGLFSLLVFLLFLLSYIHYTSQLIEITEMKREKSQEYNAVIKKGKALQAEVESLQESEYVSKLARQDYYYSNEDEIIFVLPKKERGNE